MANWTINTIRFPKRYLEYIINEKGEVDFSLVDPIPKDIKDFRNIYRDNKIDYNMCMLAYSVYFFDKFKKKISNGTIALLYFNLNEYFKDKLWVECENPTEFQGAFYVAANLMNLLKDKSTEEIDKYYELGKTVAYLCENYGTVSITEWCYNHWGCKQNAQQTTIVRETKETITYSFVTPWGPPTEWAKTLALKLCIPFNLYWDDRDTAPKGEISYSPKNGYVIENNTQR